MESVIHTMRVDKRCNVITMRIVPLKTTCAMGLNGAIKEEMRSLDVSAHMIRSVLTRHTLTTLQCADDSGWHNVCIGSNSPKICQEGDVKKASMEDTCKGFMQSHGIDLAGLKCYAACGALGAQLCPLWAGGDFLMDQYCQNTFWANVCSLSRNDCALIPSKDRNPHDEQQVDAFCKTMSGIVHDICHKWGGPAQELCEMMHYDD